MAIDPKLVDLLACPKCHGALALVTTPEGFACEACKLFYAVDDGLPNMLIEDARRWPLDASATGPAR